MLSKKLIICPIDFESRIHAVSFFVEPGVVGFCFDVEKLFPPSISNSIKIKGSKTDDFCSLMNRREEKMIFNWSFYIQSFNSS
jgi:hypothetical protein